MADNQVDVKFGGDSGEAQKAIADVTKSLKDGVGSMQGSLGTLMDGFGQFKGILVGFTAALAGGAAFKASISAANDWNGEVTKLSKTMGTTTEDASVMAVALNHVGVSTDTLSGASMMLSKNMNSNEDAFKTLGVTTKDATTGAFRPVGDVMKDVNEKLKGIHNTAQQNVAGMQVYGRGWSEIKGVLKLNDEAMKEAEQKAKDLHLIVGPEGAAATKKYKEEQRDLALITKSLEIQVGNALLPVMVELGKWLGEVGPDLCKYFTKALEIIVAMVKVTVGVVTMLGNSVKAVGAYAIMEDAPEAAEQMLREVEDSNRNAVRNIGLEWDKLLGKAPAPWKPKTPTAHSNDGPALDFSKGKDKKEKAEPDKRLQEWKSELERKKEAEGDYFKNSQMMEEAYWTEKLAEVQGNGEKEKQIRRSIEHELYAIHKAQAAQNRSLDDEDIAAKKNAATYEIELKRESLKTQLDLGQISAQQQLTGERSLVDQQYQIDRAAINSKILLYQEDALAVAKFAEQKLGLERKHALDINKINADLLKQQKQNIDQMLTPITNAISTSVQGMVQGTTTMTKALQNIFKSIGAMFLDMCAKMVKDWAVKELANTALAQKQGMIRTLFEKMGLIETAAATTTSEATKTATTIAASEAQIPFVAGLAAGEAAASVASIPYVGPAMAAAAYAETYALVMSGLTGFAVGSWNVPGDMVTKIHQGEMIVPAEFADSVRNGGGLGGGGGDVHFHVQAVDASSVKKLFQNNAAALSEVMRRQSRNFTPTKA